MKRNEYPSLEGVTVAVSGSTGGIGREVCLSLARLGARLVCVDRSASKVAALRGELLELSPSASVLHVPLELEDRRSVLSAAERLKEIGIHYLILCAGAYHIPRKDCGGVDNIFQINFLSPYLLAREMSDHIEAAGGRIVAVGSLSYGFVRFDPKDAERRRGGDAAAYGNAKRCLMFSLWRLTAGRGGLSVVHPGISPTGITSGYPPFVRAIIKYPMRLVFMSPKKAARCVLEGVFASTDEGEWIGPRFFGVWGAPRRSKVGGYTPEEADTVISAANELLENKTATTVKIM